jgi:hypothetical protein
MDNDCEYSHMDNDCETNVVYEALLASKDLSFWKLALECKSSGRCDNIPLHPITSIVDGFVVMRCGPSLACCYLCNVHNRKLLL